MERRARDRGATLVEFALVLPLLVMILLGTITAGIALDEKQQMTHATREGARYASTVPWTQVWSSGNWASNVRDLIVERSSGTLTAADICVSLVHQSPGVVVNNSANFSTNGTSPCIANQSFPTQDNSTRVQVTSSKPAEIELGLFGSHTVTLDSNATAKSEVDYVP